MASASAKELKVREDWEEVLQSVETVLFDCDGVLWSGNGEQVAGAQDALNFIRSKGKKVCFVSNNSSKSRAEYLQRFHKLGMTAYEVTQCCVCLVCGHERRRQWLLSFHRKKYSAPPTWLHTTSSTV
jgi:ribosomal protein L30E